MGRKTIEIKKTDLEYLYIDQDLSAEVIAKKLNVSKRTIISRLKKYKIFRRSKTRKNCISLEGRRFGKLLVIEKDYTYEEKNNLVPHGVFWKCQCDCGEIVYHNHYGLTHGVSKSCGCSRFKYGSQNPGWAGYGEISATAFNQIKYCAKQREIYFNITIEYIWNLFIKQNKKCTLSNLDINIKEWYKDKTSTASLDRIDSKLGYIEGNVQWTHKDINKMKQDFTEKYFIDMCRLIVKNDDIRIIG